MSRTEIPAQLDDLLSRLNFIRHRKQECFICFSLDAEGKILARRTVTIGTLTATLVHPREVFAGSLKDRAASIVVAHNHPSGTLQPSDDDINATQQLIAAGQILGIRLLDHIIVTRDAHFSFRGNGLL